MKPSDLLGVQSNFFDKAIKVLFNVFYKFIVNKSLKQTVKNLITCYYYCYYTMETKHIRAEFLRRVGLADLLVPRMNG
jgi:ferritin-like protein